MDWVIAVRTYKRTKIFLERTYAMLTKNNLTDRLYIFVANEEEKAAYTEALAGKSYKELIVGEIGIEKATAAICKYFPVGKPLIIMDDDLKFFFNFTESGVFVKDATNLKQYLDDGFATIKEHNLGAFTFCNLQNKLYIKDKPFKEFRTRGLPGPFGGFFNEPDLIVTKYGHLEDAVRTCNFFDKYGGILVYWYAGLVNDYGNLPGGMQSYGRENIKELTSKVYSEEPLLQLYYKPPALNPSYETIYDCKQKTYPQIKKIFNQRNIAFRHLVFPRFQIV